MSIISFVTVFVFAVGNALKFTHKGSVTVRVNVATEQTALPFNTDDGNNGDLSCGII